MSFISSAQEQHCKNTDEHRTDSQLRLIQLCGDVSWDTEARAKKKIFPKSYCQWMKALFCERGIYQCVEHEHQISASHFDSEKQITFTYQSLVLLSAVLKKYLHYTQSV